MEINYDTLNGLCQRYGDAFYLLDSDGFEKNYIELADAFRAVYPNFNIAYSYKTNYTPKLCAIVNRLGGYAEVVSDMEAELALRVGVEPRMIIRNGPYKTEDEMRRLLLVGATVNLDSEYETEMLKSIAARYPTHTLNVGIRCNFEINDGVVSRFGFSTETEAFKDALKVVRETENVHFTGLQCHFAARALNTWKPRAEGMIKLIDSLGIVPERIDLGGGLFGKMDDSLKVQFASRIPEYREYAEEAATVFAERFAGTPNPPQLIIEPGTAIVGDCMRFVSRVVNIKDVRGKAIATLLGSIYNINPTLNTKNPPITRFSCGKAAQSYDDLSFGGYTCIESDYVYRHYKGELAAGDIVMLGNAGSYSVVLKPPFILPNFAVLDICGDKEEVVKRREYFDDIFHTFSFT